MVTLSPVHDVVFPPRDEWDIAAYDNEECCQGYCEYRRDPECVPGENRSPAYRWGWLNAKKDHTGKFDGYEAMRESFLKMLRRAN